MCSNYRPVTRSDRMLTYFGVEREKSEDPIDVWPMGLAPFIRLAVEGSGFKLIVHDGHFGLIPHFQRELAAGRKTYNARSETVCVRPSHLDDGRYALLRLPAVRRQFCDATRRLRRQPLQDVTQVRVRLKVIELAGS